MQKGVEWPRGLGQAIAGGSDSMGCQIQKNEYTNTTVYNQLVFSFLEINFNKKNDRKVEMKVLARSF